MEKNLKQYTLLPNHLPDFEITFKFLKSLKRFYPNIEQWLNEKYYQGEHIDGISAFHGQQLVGICLYDPRLKKIRTLKVIQPHLKKGLATALMEHALKVIGPGIITITVNEDNVPNMKPFLSEFDFKIQKIVPDEYINGKNEYHFVLEKLR